MTIIIIIVIIRCLQYALNSAVWLISMSCKADHITPMLMELHWLPVKQHINFKILLFTYKIGNGLAPMYLSELLVPYVPRRDLRSANKLLFCQLSYHTKSYGSRAFSVSTPCMWNKLPIDIKCSPSIATRDTFLKISILFIFYCSYRLLYFYHTVSIYCCYLYFHI